MKDVINIISNIISDLTGFLFMPLVSPSGIVMLKVLAPGQCRPQVAKQALTWGSMPLQLTKSFLKIILAIQVAGKMGMMPGVFACSFTGLLLGFIDTAVKSKWGGTWQLLCLYKRFGLLKDTDAQ